MIVVVGVGNVSAMAVFDLNLKAVALVPSIVDCIKVVDAAIGNALGLTACCAHQEQQIEEQYEKPRLVALLDTLLLSGAEFEQAAAGAGGA